MWISHGYTCVPHPEPPFHLPPIPSLCVWKGFPSFRSHLRMRPLSRRHSRRGLMGGSTFRRTPVSRSPLDKNPKPGHVSELPPMNEVNTKGHFFRASFGKNPRFQSILLSRINNYLSQGSTHWKGKESPDTKDAFKTSGFWLWWLSLGNVRSKELKIFIVGNRVSGMYTIKSLLNWVEC